MHDYDEKYFVAKANKRAGITWLLLLIIGTIYYGLKAGKHEVLVITYVIVTICGWLQYVLSGILLMVKGKDNPKYKWFVSIGYLAYYAVIAWMTTDQISFVFILPLISVLVLYKNPKLNKVMMWATMLILLSSNIYKGLTKGMLDFVFSEDCGLQFAIVVCCLVCTGMSIKHLIESDGALTGSIKDNLQRVVQTIEKVKAASTEVVDGVTVVRELADENRKSAENEEKTYHGKMVNISANGFDFAVSDALFASSKGKDIILEVQDFDVVKGGRLEGRIIRSSNNDGEYIVGCRMPQDSDAIKKYISRNYSE